MATQRFYPEEQSLAEQFGEKIGANTVSMAMLQGYFLSLKNKPLEAFENCQQILKQVAEENAVRKKKKLKKKKDREDKEKATANLGVSDLVKIIGAVNNNKEKEEAETEKGSASEKSGEKQQEEQEGSTEEVA